MGKIKRILASIMSLVLMIGLITNTNILSARAEGEQTQQVSFTLSIGMAEGSTAPNNYSISYTLMEDDSRPAFNGAQGVINGNSDGSVNSQIITIDVPAGYKIRIDIASAGKNILMNDADVSSEWNGGKLYTADQIKDQTIAVLLRNPSGQGDNGQNNGQGEGQGGQGQDINLSVTWSGNFGEIKIGGNSQIGEGDGTSGTKTITHASVNQDNTVTVNIQAPFTLVYSSLKVKIGDGVEQELVQGSDYRESYSVAIPKDTLNISIIGTTTASGNYTIVWTYDKGAFEDDAYVENGKVEMVSTLDGQSGHYLAHEGDSVTVKLIPDYGYQVVGATLNGGATLSPDGNNISQFTFTMPNTNVHFKGVFRKTEDLIENNVSSVVSKTSFTGKDVATTGGTAKMKLNNASPSDTSAVSKEIDTTKTVQAINIEMEQLFYKNNANAMWTTPKTELPSEATVALTVTEDPSVGYAVLREHDGKIEEIPANYDAGSNTITFKSAKYSTYTLVPLKEANNTLPMPDTGEKPNNRTGAKKEPAEETPSIEAIEAQEVNRPVQLISIDKTQVSNEVSKEVPGKTYNLTSYTTAKGFVAAIEKIVKKNPSEKRVYIYTSKPICFTKAMLSNITKMKVDVVYYFMHKGHLYSVTIPANTDIQKIFGKTNFQGPLYIGKVLGTSRLIK